MWSLPRYRMRFPRWRRHRITGCSSGDQPVPGRSREGQASGRPSAWNAVPHSSDIRVAGAAVLRQGTIGGLRGSPTAASAAPAAAHVRWEPHSQRPRTYNLHVGRVAAIVHRYRTEYRVLAEWPVGKREEWSYGKMRDARRCADQAARDGAAAAVLALRNGRVSRRGRPVYMAQPRDDGADGGNVAGVREPRRPTPGYSSGAVALDLPE